VERPIFITHDNDKLKKVFQSRSRVFALVRPGCLDYLKKKGVPYYIVTQRGIPCKKRIFIAEINLINGRSIMKMVIIMATNTATRFSGLFFIS
jgi:hypothetical protein